MQEEAETELQKIRPIIPYEEKNDAALFTFPLNMELDVFPSYNGNTYYF